MHRKACLLLYMKCDHETKTPAHHTDQFAELVCSNILRANGLTNAVGVLKEEMREWILSFSIAQIGTLFLQEERLQLIEMASQAM